MKVLLCLLLMAGYLFGVSSYSESDALNRAQLQLDDTYNQVRSLSHHLMPPSIKEKSLSALVKSYINELATGIPFTVDFNSYNLKDIDKISNHTKLELYRIIQELMTNIVKHAHSNHVDIQLNKSETGINLMIEDNGQEFDTNRASQGIGLKSITSRVNQIKGQIHIDSTPSLGTTVSIDIPLSQTEMYEGP